MDAKTRDEEASRGKKESILDSVKKKVTSALTPDFIKKINKKLDSKESK